MICYFESLSTTKKTRICYLGGILFHWASRGFGSEDGPGARLTLGEIVRRGVWSPEDHPVGRKCEPGCPTTDLKAAFLCGVASNALDNICSEVHFAHSHFQVTWFTLAELRWFRVYQRVRAAGRTRGTGCWSLTVGLICFPFQIRFWFKIVML